MNTDYLTQFVQFFGGLFLIVAVLVIVRYWAPLAPMVMLRLWGWWIEIKNAIRITFMGEPIEENEDQRVIYPRYLWAHSHWPWM